MIEVFINKRFGVRTSVAIERHVHNKYRNVLPRNAQLYHVALRPPNYPVPAVILDVTPRPMGLAIWRCYDGVDGDRFTIERKWWFGTTIN